MGKATKPGKISKKYWVKSAFRKTSKEDSYEKSNKEGIKPTEAE